MDNLTQVPPSATTIGVYSVPEYLKEWLDITHFPSALPCGRGGYATVKRLACTNGKEAAVKKIYFKPGERDTDGIQVDMKVSNIQNGYTTRFLNLAPARSYGGQVLG